MINYDLKAYITPAIAAEVTTIKPNMAATGCILESAENAKMAIMPSPTQPASIEKMAVIIFRKFIECIIERLATKCKQYRTKFLLTIGVMIAIMRSKLGICLFRTSNILRNGYE